MSSSSSEMSASATVLSEIMTFYDKLDLAGNAFFQKLRCQVNDYIDANSVPLADRFPEVMELLETPKYKFLKRFMRSTIYRALDLCDDKYKYYYLLIMPVFPEADAQHFDEDLIKFRQDKGFEFIREVGGASVNRTCDGKTVTISKLADVSKMKPRSFQEIVTYVSEKQIMLPTELQDKLVDFLSDCSKSHPMFRSIFLYEKALTLLKNLCGFHIQYADQSYNTFEVSWKYQDDDYFTARGISCDDIQGNPPLSKRDLQNIQNACADIEEVFPNDKVTFTTDSEFGYRIVLTITPQAV